MENKKITKEEAIRKHRTMWNWIAERIERIQHVVDISEMKKVYVEREENRNELVNDCYCCEYAFEYAFMKNGTTNKMCVYCPLIWKTEEDGVKQYQCEVGCKSDNGDFEDGQWWECRGLYDRYDNPWGEQARLAREIANLPERNNV